MQYRRANNAGATYFFTLTLADRNSLLLIENINHLRDVIRNVRNSHPFEIIAMVVLPDHLHTIWQLPEGDANFPMRWSLIKAGFSRAIPKSEIIKHSRVKKRERGIWQRRYWEHLIRDDADLEKHVAYIHFNPVKHGYANKASDWPHSSIHRYIKNGWCDVDWGYLDEDVGVNMGE
jgi:putative transposase